MLDKIRALLKKRNRKGSALSEFGPALWILLFCLFFPMVNLLGLSISYGVCTVLNSNQVHEASLLHYSAAIRTVGPIKKGIPDQWLNGMGQFANLSRFPRTKLRYLSSSESVGVRTEFSCNPFLPVPIPVAKVPGINAPMNFTIYSERPMENPDNSVRKVYTSRGRVGIITSDEWWF